MATLTAAAASRQWDIFISTSGKEETQYRLSPGTRISAVKSMWSQGADVSVNTIEFISSRGQIVTDGQSLSDVGETYPGSRVVELTARFISNWKVIVSASEKEYQIYRLPPDTKVSEVRSKWAQATRIPTDAIEVISEQGDQIEDTLSLADIGELHTGSYLMRLNVKLKMLTIEKLEFDKLKTKLWNTEQAVKQRDSQVDTLKVKLRDAEEVTQQRNKQIEDKEAKLKEAEEEIQQRVKQIEDKEAKLKEEIQQRVKQIEDKEAKLKEAEEEIQQRDKQIEDKEAKLKEAQEGIQQRGKQIEDQETKLKDAEDEIQRRDKRIEELEAKLKDVEEGIQERDIKIDGLELKLKNFDEEIKQRDQIEDQEGKLKDADEGIQRDIEIEELTAKLKEVEERIQQRDKEIEELEEQLNDSEEDIQRREIDIQELKAKLENAGLTIKQQDSVISEWTAKLRDAEQTFKQWAVRISEENENCRDYEQHLAKQRDSLINELKASLRNAEQRNAQFKALLEREKVPRRLRAVNFSRHPCGTEFDVSPALPYPVTGRALTKAVAKEMGVLPRFLQLQQWSGTSTDGRVFVDALGADDEPSAECIDADGNIRHCSELKDRSAHILGDEEVVTMAPGRRSIIGVYDLL